jgi:hypothetical protein
MPLCELAEREQWRCAVWLLVSVLLQLLQAIGASDRLMGLVMLPKVLLKTVHMLRQLLQQGCRQGSERQVAWLLGAAGLQADCSQQLLR